MTEEYFTLWEHLAILRNTLLRILLVILIGTFITFFFYKEIFQIITWPLKSSEQNLEAYEIKHQKIFNSGSHEIEYFLPAHTIVSKTSFDYTNAEHSITIPANHFIETERSLSTTQLILLSPTEGMITGLKVSFWISLVGTSPVWLFFLLQFMGPALHTPEKRLLLPFTLLAYIFLSFGLLFAYFFTIPLANSYLESFNREIGINMWTLSSYIDFSITLFLANAFAFELAFFMILLVHFNIISSEMLIAKRRHMIVGAFVIGAILTPPDIFTQLALALPLIGLYELIVLYAMAKRRFMIQEYG